MLFCARLRARNGPPPCLCHRRAPKPAYDCSACAWDGRSRFWGFATIMLDLQHLLEHLSDEATGAAPFGAAAAARRAGPDHGSRGLPSVAAGARCAPPERPPPFPLGPPGICSPLPLTP